jgi:hypothetical protein
MAKRKATVEELEAQAESNGYKFKPDGTFYAPNEPREKMKKCSEWTEEQAIPALYASGVLLRNA